MHAVHGTRCTLYYNVDRASHLETFDESYSLGLLFVYYDIDAACAVSGKYPYKAFYQRNTLQFNQWLGFCHSFARQSGAFSSS
jgi:hypothetical protein